MRFANWMAFRKQDNEGGDAGGQGGGGAGQQQAGGVQNKNNDGANNEDHGSIWDDPADGGNANNGEQNRNNDGQQQQQADPSAIFAKHVEGLNLTEGLDFASVEPGDHAGMQKLFQTALGNVYKAAMVDANRLMQTNVDKAVKAAVAQSGENVTTTMAVKEMHSTLPFTNDPDVGPVAKAVLTRHLNKGLPLSQAIEKTRSYFSKVSNLVNGNQNNSNNRSGFNAHQSQQKEETDFLDLFGAPADD